MFTCTMYVFIYYPLNIVQAMYVFIYYPLNIVQAHLHSNYNLAVKFTLTPVLQIVEK